MLQEGEQIPGWVWISIKEEELRAKTDLVGLQLLDFVQPAGRAKRSRNWKNGIEPCQDKSKFSHQVTVEN